jgi:hypothetical protein
MATQERPTVGVRATPYLVVYASAFLAAWVLAAVTWEVTADGLALHPLAAALQYALAALASALAALYVRRAPDEQLPGGSFRWYDHEWSIPDDRGGRSFWFAVLLGAFAIELNVVLLVAADVVLAGAAAGLGTYLGWFGAGIAAGALLGMLGAVIASVLDPILRRIA